MSDVFAFATSGDDCSPSRPEDEPGNTSAAWRVGDGSKISPVRTSTNATPAAVRSKKRSVPRSIIV